MIGSTAGWERSYTCIALMVLAGGGGCRTERAPAPAITLWTQGDTLGPRRFANATLDSLWSAFPNDTSRKLFYPVAIRSWEGGIAVRDEAERLINFSTAGKVSWSVGLPTHQKRRVRRFTDAAVEGKYLVALDEIRHALLFLDRSGTIVDSMVLASEIRLDRFAPVGGGRYLLVNVSGSRPLTVVSRGNAVDSTSVTVPWTGFYHLQDMQRQVGVAVGENGRWAMHFLLGNGWFGFDNTKPVGVTGRYVDHHAFPELRVQKRGDRVRTTFAGYTPCTGCDAALVHDTLWVLAGGSNATKRERLDAFSIASAKYLISIQLPAPIRAFAWRQDTLLVAPETPGEGTIIAYRLHKRTIPQTAMR